MDRIGGEGRRRTDAAMILAWLCYYDGLIAIAAVAAGIISAHWELTAPFFGFQLVLIGLVFAVLALLSGMIALPMTYFSPQRRAGLSRARIGVILALMIFLPLAYVGWKTKDYPLINDITTDTQKPPVFVKANEYQPKRGRDLTYNPQNAAIQNSSPAYQGLAPLKVDEPPDEVFKKVAILAGEVPSWQITRNDPQNRTLEGVATSGLFKFKDDFIIEVRPADGGSLIEMRSKSRDGKGDLGTNYHRIVSFLSIVKAGPQTPVPGAAQVQP
jgi:uncharacterized protein (DUF1499 family)